MRLLARYLAQQVLVATGFLLLALLVLFAFFDVMEELGSLGRNNYGLGQAAVVVLLSMPGHLYEILPVAALIGTLFALSRLVGNSEYAVMRVSGLSNWRVAGYFAVSARCSPAGAAGRRIRDPVVGSDRAALQTVGHPFGGGAAVPLRAVGQGRHGVHQRARSDARQYPARHRNLRLRCRRPPRLDPRRRRGQLARQPDLEPAASGGNALRHRGYPCHPQRAPGLAIGTDARHPQRLLVAPEKMSARTSGDMWRISRKTAKSHRYELALWTKFLSPFVIPS